MDETTKKEVDALLTQPTDCSVWPDHPAHSDPNWCVGPRIDQKDGETEARCVTLGRIEALKKRDDLCGMWALYVLGHASGWAQHLSFRVLGDDGEPTPMFHFMKGWQTLAPDEGTFLEAQFHRAVKPAWPHIPEGDGKWHISMRAVLMSHTATGVQITEADALALKNLLTKVYPEENGGG